MDIKWLFFDIGSTLVDETKCINRRFREISEASGRSYEEVSKIADGFYRDNKIGDHETADFLGVPIQKWHSEYETAYPEAPQCLELLGKNFKIGIIANQSLGSKERLEKRGILKYIDLLVASAEEGVSKPDRRIFEIALERANVNPENAVMIGDRLDNDIAPAKAMGLYTVLIKQGPCGLWTPKDESQMSDYTVDNLTELCELIIKITGT